MSYRVFNVDEVACYLHLSPADVQELLKNDEIPHEIRGGRRVFCKGEIDAWASQRILGLPGRRLTEYHQKSSRATQGIFEEGAVMPQMMSPEYVEPALPAKTRASVVREMVALAEKTEQVNDPRELLASLEAREGLCSTALPGGLALLHPRHHQPYMFESSFIVLGRTLQDIPFGAPDGKSTDLFFLICCQDDRVHLHTLARLCMITLKTDLLARLRELPDAESIYNCILAGETQVLSKKA